MQKNYNENLVAGAAIRDDKGRRISKLFEASHPKMTVGYAKNLIMPDTPTEQEFNLRQAGGGVIEDGVAVIDKVKGNSVVWNQLVEATKSLTANGVHLEKNGNFIKVYTDTDGATATTIYTDMLGNKQWSDVAIVGHMYAMSGCPNGGSLNSFRMSCYSSNVWQGEKFDTGNGVVFSVTDSVPNGYPRMVVSKGTIITTPIYFRPQLIDLTQMFGAGNEPTTYEEFLQRKPKVENEFAYNEGTIVNNKVEMVKTAGVNLWDEEWEKGYIDVNNGGVDKPSSTTFRSKNYTPIPSGATLYVNRGGYNATLTIAEYDAKKAYIGFESIYSNGTIKMPSNVAFIRFYLEPDANTSVYNHDICINLSDPTINGKYFPYEEHTLDLSWVKEIKDAEGVKLFEDGMRSAGSVYDEVGKNKAVKRIRKYVFDGSEPINGSLLNDDGTAFRVTYNALFNTTSTGVRDAVSIGAGFYSKYNGGYYFDLWVAGFAAVKAYIICVPSSIAKTGDEMKEYLKQKYNEGNPLVVYYELAEPIEVEYDEKNLTYPVVAGGTEEAIASEPSTAFRADIGYGIDAVKTILDLKARVEALEAK